MNARVGVTGQLIACVKIGAVPVLFIGYASTVRFFGNFGFADDAAVELAAA